jgi:prolyl oligopeptidase
VYHGTRVADPYRWLERVGTPEVRGWATAQNALVSQVVSGDSLHDWFLQRMRHHAEVWYRFERAGADDSVGARPPTIDPRTLPPRKRLVRSQVSPDGQHIVYSLSEGGSEWVETRIRRVADGADLPEVLEGLLGGAPLWSRDGRGLFYVHQRRGSDEDRVMLLEPSVRYHTIDTPQSADRVLFATPPGSVESVLNISYASSGRYLVIAEGSGAVWDSFAWVLSRVHLLDLGQGPVPAITNPVTPLIADKIAGYRVVASDGPTLFVMTDRGAPRKRLVALDVRDPAPEKWRDVIPEDAKLVLHAMHHIDDRWVAVYFADAQPLIRVFSHGGELLRSLDLPPFSSVLQIASGEQESELIVSTSSFLQPPTRTTFDVLTGAARVRHTISSDFDAASYVTTQQWYTSKDGARVPMFLVHRKNISLDGSHPVLMLGYGASGTVMLPDFAENVVAWLEAGGVFAVPSLRGGGEFGRDWYEAAILDRKQTTIDDFIAAAEWLIENGYTKPERLAIRGGSNGGLLVSAAITQRPDLFGAAVAEVPLTDNLRYDRGRHRGQFGHVSDSVQFAFLYRYSPLHRVKQGTCYPATLIITALNDDRAPAWHALKLTAALQAAQSCDRPILLRAHDVGGHLGDRGPDSWMEDAADAMAFVGRRFGMRGDQLRNRP